MEKQFSYEDGIVELNGIIEKIENGALPMNEMLKLFERGVKLVKLCYGQLDKAKGKMTEIKESLDGLEEI